MHSKQSLPDGRPARLAVRIDRELALERSRNALYDADIVVDDARQELVDAIRRLRVAAVARDDCARQFVETVTALEAA